MEESASQKKDVYALVVDIVIVVVAVLISVILLIQHKNTAQVTIDTREDRYYRPVDVKKRFNIWQPGSGSIYR